jgi:hypothetical protein
MNIKTVAKFMIGTGVIGGCMFSAINDNVPTKEEKIKTEMYDNAVKSLDFASKNEYIATKLIQKMDSDSIKTLKNIEKTGVKELKQVIK